MSRTTKSVVAALAIVCLAVAPALATEKLAEKEQVKCRVCHVKTGSALLTNKGKYYEYKRTFDGYKQVLHKFKKCTLCHVKEPGSADLTPAGRELKNRDVTMDHLSAVPKAPEKSKQK